MGLHLLLDQSNFVDRHLLFHGIWELDQVERLCKLVKEAQRVDQPTLFLDIGAHGALYSLLINERIECERIIAFEPVSSNLVQLRANLLLNDALSRVEVIEAAVGESEGVMRFVVAVDENRGRSRIMTGAVESGEKVIEVAVTMVDRVVDCRDTLIVAKIDVEGAELSVLRGMSKLLAQNRVILQIECNQRSVRDLDAALSPFGLRRVDEIGADYYYVNL